MLDQKRTRNKTENRNLRLLDGRSKLMQTYQGPQNLSGLFTELICGALIQGLKFQKKIQRIQSPKHPGFFSKDNPPHYIQVTNISTNHYHPHTNPLNSARSPGNPGRPLKRHSLPVLLSWQLTYFRGVPSLDGYFFMRYTTVSSYILILHSIIQVYNKERGKYNFNLKHFFQKILYNKVIRGTGLAQIYV